MQHIDEQTKKLMDLAKLEALNMGKRKGTCRKCN